MKKQNKWPGVSTFVPVTPISDYYIINGTVYQAPDLCSVISSRMVSSRILWPHNIHYLKPFSLIPCLANFLKNHNSYLWIAHANFVIVSENLAKRVRGKDDVDFFHLIVFSWTPSIIWNRLSLRRSLTLAITRQRDIGGTWKKRKKRVRLKPLN